MDGTTLLATHARSYNKDLQVEDPAHIAELVGRKRQARAHRGINRLAQAAANSRELLSRATARGENLGFITASLVRLLEHDGAAELNIAIAEALERGVPPSQRRRAARR